MHEVLLNAGRDHVRQVMAKLTPENHRIFALMYGRDGGRRSVEDAVAMSLEDILNEVPPERLSWVMQQVDNTLAKQTN